MCPWYPKPRREIGKKLVIILITNKTSNKPPHKPYPQVLTGARSTKDKVNAWGFVSVKTIKPNKHDFISHRVFLLTLPILSLCLMILTEATCNIPSGSSPQSSTIPKLPLSLVSSGCHSAATGYPVCHQPECWKALGFHLVKEGFTLCQTCPLTF